MLDWITLPVWRILTEAFRITGQDRQWLRSQESQHRGSLYRQIITTAEARLIKGANIEPDKSQKEITKRQLVLISPYEVSPNEKIILQYVTSAIGTQRTRLIIESKAILPSIDKGLLVFRLAFNPNIRGLSDAETATHGLNGWGGFTDSQAYENLLSSIQSWEAIPPNSI